MARWDKFELMLESHELMVKEQVRHGGTKHTIYRVVFLVVVSVIFRTLYNS